MGKAVLEAVEFHHRHHGNQLTDFIQQVLHVYRIRAGILVVQPEIKQRKFQLTHGHHGALEMLGRQQFIQQLLWQRLAGLVVTGNKRQRLRLVAPVLHKLTGQLHRIPGHAINTADIRYVDGGEHVVQAVTKFMEQRGQFVVGQQRRFIAHRRREVTHQIGHRQLNAAIGSTPADATIVHPRAAALFRAGV